MGSKVGYEAGKTVAGILKGFHRDMKGKVDFKKGGFLHSLVKVDKEECFGEVKWVVSILTHAQTPHEQIEGCFEEVDIKGAEVGSFDSEAGAGEFADLILKDLQDVIAGAKKGTILSRFECDEWVEVRWEA